MKILRYLKLHCDLTSSSRRSYVEENILKSGPTKRHTWPPIIPASHPTAPSFSAARSPLPSQPNPWLSNARRFNGPPQFETPGKIIQISSLRFPSNPDERGRSTRVDAQHAGLPRGLACQLTSTKADQIINRRLLIDPEQPDEAQKNGVPENDRNREKKIFGEQ